MESQDIKIKRIKKEEVGVARTSYLKGIICSNGEFKHNSGFYYRNLYKPKPIFFTVFFIYESNKLE